MIRALRRWRVGRAWARDTKLTLAARDVWLSTLPDPVRHDGRLILPCPYCGIRGGHTGTCRLSLMRSGRVFVVFGEAKP